VEAEREVDIDVGVTLAAGHVGSDRGPVQATGIGLPLGMSQQKPAPQAPSRPFQPTPPSAVRRPVRRMPSIEELPVVAQNAIKAKSGESPGFGLREQKKKVGFLERLANVGRSRKEPDAEMPAKREPEFGQAWGGTPTVQAPRPQPQAPSAAPRGIRIERPRHEPAPPSVPKRIEAPARPVAVEMAESASESLMDDDLEIPAFLRRRAN
jgi:cell division protein FtsZ